MMTTSIVSTLRTSFLLVAAFAFLMSVGSVGATPQKRAGSDPNAAGTAAVCGALGGNASVVNDGFELQIDGSKGRSKTSTTHCQGGLLDGMTCTNYDNGTSDCSMGLVQGDDLPQFETTGEVVVDVPALQPLEETAIETVEVAVDPADEPASTEEPASVEESVEPVGTEDTDPAPADVADETDVHEDGESDPVVTGDPVVTADPATVDQTIDHAPVDGAVVEDVVADPVADPAVADSEIVYDAVDATMEWEEIE